MDIKVEMDIDNSYCRFCFQMFTVFNDCLNITDNFLINVNQLLQLQLSINEGSKLVCIKCFNIVNSFINFKNQVIESQTKFGLLVANSQHKIVENIQKITTNIDTDIFKEEVIVKTEPLEECNPLTEEVLMELTPLVDISKKEKNTDPIKKRTNKKKKIKQKRKCQECLLFFSNLDTHYMRKHGYKLKYACKNCYFQTNSKTKLQSHGCKSYALSMKHRYVKSKCPYCQKEFNNRNMHKHIDARHKKMMLCDLCSFAHPKKQYMINHMLSNHSLKALKCPKCDYITHTNIQLLNHMKNKHEPRNKDGTVTCPTCNRVLQNQTTLDMHIKRIHDRELNFKCDVPECDKYFFSNSEKKAHYRGFHQKPLMCDLCGKHFGIEKVLKNHIRAVHEGVTYPCGTCGLEFKTKEHVKRHMNKIHLDLRNFTCDTCGSAFHETDELKHHINLVHLKIRYHCDVPNCSSSFSQRSAYRYHLSKNHDLSTDEREEIEKKIIEFVKKHKLRK